MIKESKKFTKYQLKTAFEYFNDLFNKPGQNPTYSAFIYANHEILLPHYLALQQAVYDENNDPQYREFQHKARDIQVKYADVDENDKKKFTENGEPIVTVNREAAMKEIGALQEEYKELIARIQNKNQTNSALYGQTVELEVVVLPATQFVNDAPPYIVGAFITGAI